MLWDVIGVKRGDTVGLYHQGWKTGMLFLDYCSMAQSLQEKRVYTTSNGIASGGEESR
jgi:hypothetical protein